MSDWLKEKFTLFEEKLDRIDNKCDKFDDRLDRLEVNNVAMSQDLKYHIRRTDILENELKPIKTRYEQMVGVIKFFGAVIALSGSLEFIFHFFYRV